MMLWSLQYRVLPEPARQHGLRPLIQPLVGNAAPVMDLDATGPPHPRAPDDLQGSRTRDRDGLPVRCGWHGVRAPRPRESGSRIGTWPGEDPRPDATTSIAAATATFAGRRPESVRGGPRKWHPYRDPPSPCISARSS